mgnify:CR=1 FL=1
MKNLMTMTVDLNEQTGRVSISVSGKSPAHVIAPLGILRLMCEIPSGNISHGIREALGVCVKRPESALTALQVYADVISAAEMLKLKGGEETCTAAN